MVSVLVIYATVVYFAECIDWSLVAMHLCVKEVPDSFFKRAYLLSVRKSCWMLSRKRLRS